MGVPGDGKEFMTAADFSKDGGKAGWYVCNPICTLYSYDIKSSIYKSIDTPCEWDSSYFDWQWKDGEAKPGYSWGLATKTKMPKGLCTDKDGNLLYDIKPKM